MNHTSNLSFSVQPFEGAVAVAPIVDGISFSEIVSIFEREHGFDPVGGYGGLIPRWFKYGRLDEYFLGEFDVNSYFRKMGRIYLLGCGDCGEVGCWPLLARVSVAPTEVLWDSFEQPHRQQRDYSKLGPFRFRAEQYREAVAGIAQTPGL
jgi:hypothetical protein